MRTLASGEGSEGSNGSEKGALTSEIGVSGPGLTSTVMLSAWTPRTRLSPLVHRGAQQHTCQGALGEVVSEVGPGLRGARARRCSRRPARQTDTHAKARFRLAAAHSAHACGWTRG
eukprot:302979-Rhodomonas_salina.2